MLSSPHAIVVVVFIFATFVVLFAVATYGPKKAKLYDLKITETKFGGNIVERKESENMNDDEAVRDYNAKMMKGWFQFVQTEDGSIPVTRFSREENREIVNIKKAVVSAFQANFEGSSVKEEADPQSLHKAEYTYVLTGNTHFVHGQCACRCGFILGGYTRGRFLAGNSAWDAR